MKLTIHNEFIGFLVLELLLLLVIALDEIWGLTLPLLRSTLGLLFVLFAPGYTLQAVFFPWKRDLDGLERTALSFGLSIAIIPPLALVLDSLPWGIQLTSIVFAETLLVSLGAVIVLIGRRWLPPEERPVWTLALDIKGWWQSQDRFNRYLAGIVGLAMGVALISALAIIVLPRPAERFTEFYILGTEGLAEGYPRETIVGQPVTLTVGISNREGHSSEYRVEAHDGEQVIGQSDPLRLENGEIIELPISFVPSRTGNDIPIRIFLYRNDQSQPYRSLRLWINVMEPAG